jgi:hypothetical protein
MKSDLNDLKKLTLELIQNGLKVRRPIKFDKKNIWFKENDEIDFEKNLVHR